MYLFYSKKQRASQLLLHKEVSVLSFLTKSSFSAKGLCLPFLFKLFQMGVPLSMDEIPQLPEPEGSILREQLKQVTQLFFIFA